jgi:hypothetical protein
MAALGEVAIDKVAFSMPSIGLPPRPSSVRAVRYPTVEFGGGLREQCEFFAGGDGITITCATARKRLPWAVASQLSLVAEELLTRAFVAFQGGRGGRIQVRFAASPTALELTIEHSRPQPRAAGRQLAKDSKLVWRVVERLGGRLDNPRMIGGDRMTVTVPQP